MTEEGVITAIIVTSREAAEGVNLIENGHTTGAEFDYIVGASAYSSRENLVSIASQGCKLVAPLYPRFFSVSTNRAEGFTYNKDANRYVCSAGQMAVRKSQTVN